MKAIPCARGVAFRRRCLTALHLLLSNILPPCYYMCSVVPCLTDTRADTGRCLSSSCSTDGQRACLKQIAGQMVHRQSKACRPAAGCRYSALRVACVCYVRQRSASMRPTCLPEVYICVCDACVTRICVCRCGGRHKLSDQRWRLSAIVPLSWSSSFSSRSLCPPLLPTPTPLP